MAGEAGGKTIAGVFAQCVVIGSSLVRAGGSRHWHGIRHVVRTSFRPAGKGRRCRKGKHCKRKCEQRGKGAERAKAAMHG
jgi:hypothetical protein